MSKKLTLIVIAWAVLVSLFAVSAMIWPEQTEEALSDIPVQIMACMAPDAYTQHHFEITLAETEDIFRHWTVTWGDETDQMQVLDALVTAAPWMLDEGWYRGDENYDRYTAIKLKFDVRGETDVEKYADLLARAGLIHNQTIREETENLLVRELYIRYYTNFHQIKNLDHPIFFKYYLEDYLTPQELIAEMEGRWSRGGSSWIVHAARDNGFELEKIQALIVKDLSDEDDRTYFDSWNPFKSAVVRYERDGFDLSFYFEEKFEGYMEEEKYWRATRYAREYLTEEQAALAEAAYVEKAFASGKGQKYLTVNGAAILVVAAP
ncbi:MAG: hypothetical protein ABH826_04715 [Patescibacteria group bacterium]